MAPRDRSGEQARRLLRRRISDEDEELNESGFAFRARVYVLIILALIFNIASMLRTTKVVTGSNRGSYIPNPKYYTKESDPLWLAANPEYIKEVQERWLAARNASAETKRKAEEQQPPFIPSKFDYSQEPHKTNNTLSDPHLQLDDVSSPPSHLFVLVMSERKNFEARQAIRDSWGKGHSNIVFVVGGPLLREDLDPDKAQTQQLTTEILQKEQSLYNDLLDCMHPDTYRSLPFKLHYAMKWLHKQNAMKHFHWILKVDDDVVVRLNRLQHLVLQKYDYKHPTVIGNIVNLSKKMTRGKWAEDPHYTPLRYPPWPRGASGYAMSQRVAEYVGRTPSLYYYQGEDASLGIWLDEAHAEFGKPSAMTYIHTEDFTSDKGCAANHVINGHDMSPEKIKRCFKSQGGDVIEQHKSRIYHQGRPVELHVQVDIEENLED